jgi:hypothetical protein
MFTLKFDFRNRTQSHMDLTKLCKSVAFTVERKGRNVSCKVRLPAANAVMLPFKGEGHKLLAYKGLDGNPKSCKVRFSGSQRRHTAIQRRGSQALGLQRSGRQPSVLQGQVFRQPTPSYWHSGEGVTSSWLAKVWGATLSPARSDFRQPTPSYCHAGPPSAGRGHAVP